MAWKPKEKPLTAEEAVEAARKELAPLWLGSAPLLAGIRGADGKSSVHPLDKSFDQGAWLVLFADLTLFSGESALRIAHEWRKRYASFDVHLLLVVRRSFSFMGTAAVLEPFLGKIFEIFPTVLDLDGALASAFGVDVAQLPAARLYQQRKLVFAQSGEGWSLKAEEALQKFLRIKDPGLALAPPFKLGADVPMDHGSADFGTARPSQLFSFSGKVVAEPERVLIKDTESVVRFTSPFPRVSLIAQAVGTSEVPSRMKVELNGEAVFEAASGEHLTFGDDGGSEVKLTAPRIYHLLKELPPKNREITLKFPDADRIPVALFGVRFSR